MATAREVRAAVRAQLAEQVKARQDAALAVAAAWAKIGKARDKLAAAERDAAEAVMAATAQLSIADLAALAGIPEPELRRLARSHKTKGTADDLPAAATQAQPASDPTPAEGAGTGPDATLGAAAGTAEPVARSA